MSDVIEEKEIPIEDECDKDELDTDTNSKDRIMQNLKAAGVILPDDSETVKTS